MSSRARRPTPRRALRRLSWALILLVGLLAMASCSTLGYYGQAIWGQTRILVKRRDVGKLVADPATPDELRAKLRTVARLVDFAAGEIGLPDNGSYRTYVELPPAPDGSRRRAVVWNVTAAPELSTRPLTWCFPIAGCVSYRGYFSRRRAERFAERLARRGFDVAVGGAAAYSTLGWFRDPVLSTVVDYPEVDLAALVFHELAQHPLQRVVRHRGRDRGRPPLAGGHRSGRSGDGRLPRRHAPGRTVRRARARLPRPPPGRLRRGRAGRGEASAQGKKSSPS